MSRVRSRGVGQTVRIYCQTRNTSLEGYLQTGNTAKILKIKGGYYDPFTKQQLITINTRASAKWKENSSEYKEEDTG